MGNQHAISALVRKRAELAGDVIGLRRQIADLQDKLKVIDTALSLIGYEGAPGSIKPVRKQANRLFKNGQLSRLVYDAMRQGARDNAEITDYVMAHMGWDIADRARYSDIRRRVKDVTKKLVR